jgi:large subunit ribosomal protein L15
MSLSLSNLYPSIGSKKNKKRIGRGNASGTGTYAGRGLKGQRSRSGGKGGLKLRGLKAMMLSTPKLDGFKSHYPKNQVVKLSQLDQNFKAGDVINAAVLAEKGMIKSVKLPIKILNDADFDKKLTIEKCFVSQVAREKIEAAGGEIKE